MSNFGFCGSNCETCPALVATLNNDKEEKKKLAELWSLKFKCEIKPENIICDGCTTHTGRVYWSECGIYKCGKNKKISSCAECLDFGTCDKIQNKILNSTERKANLQSLRSKK